MVYVDSALLTN